MDKNGAIEIGQHEFGMNLGTIDTDNAEVLWCDGVDTVGKLATGFPGGSYACGAFVERYN